MWVDITVTLACKVKECDLEITENLQFAFIKEFDKRQEKLDFDVEHEEIQGEDDE